VTGFAADGVDGRPGAPFEVGAEPEPELLVVLGPGIVAPGEAGGRPGGGAARTAIDALRAVVPVSGAYPPRLALVALSAETAARIAGEPYVAGVFTGTVPDEIVATLDAGERIFVAGWLARGSGSPKRRPGDGMPWDAPGRLPPDPPPPEELPG
jgi:hypothetical protein